MSDPADVCAMPTQALTAQLDTERAAQLLTQSELAAVDSAVAAELHPDSCWCDDCCRCGVCQHVGCICGVYDDDD